METKKIIVDPKNLVTAVKPAQVAKEWTNETGRLLFIKSFPMKPESIEKAKQQGIKNPQNDKTLICRTDQPNSEDKLMLLRNFLGYAEKSGINPVIKEGKQHILNPNLKATFSQNGLALEEIK